MKKCLVIILIVLTSTTFYSPTNVLAQTVVPAPTKINARILPTIWYSTLSINDGDTIKIYAGLQNNSGVNFSGTAIFYIDNKEISKTIFDSTTDSLKDISASWIADPGSHDVQVKISASLSPDKILISADSDVSKINITRKLTPEVIQGAVMNTATSIVDKTDELASVLADKMNKLKEPVTTDKLNLATSTAKGLVLGTSTSKSINSNKSAQPISPFNMLIDFTVFLIKNWKWTLSGLVFVYVVAKLIRRNK